MKDEKNILESAISEGINDCDLHLSEIPDLDLYIDQILTLVSSKSKTASDRYRDNVLTKTMINNYSKEGLLMPVKGKKYTKEHIVQMLLIYSLKNTLSIGEIHRVLEGARSEGVCGEELMNSYERHLEGKKLARSYAAECTKSVDRNEGLESKNGSDFLVSLLDLLSLSAYIRSIAIELLEARYPTVEKEKDKEKEKKSEKEKKDKEKKSSASRSQSDSSEGAEPDEK